MKDIDGKPVSLDTLCRKEPEWAANRIRDCRSMLKTAKEWVTTFRPECGCEKSTRRRDRGNGTCMYCVGVDDLLARIKKEIA